MIYGIIASNKLHLSEIGHSLKKSITLKKTIEHLSRNLHNFKTQTMLWDNYLSLVRQHIKDEYAVIVIDNSDITKPASTKPEALADVRDRNTGEITKGYQTIEASVPSEIQKMPLPVYKKVFLSAETGFISETHENLCCLKPLSANFSTRCIRTLDRGFDTNDYYRYFLKNKERFIIREKRIKISFIT